jgi:predicted transcriptional regulator
MAEIANRGANRHAILDLAPLELDCMNALWPSGEATVREIQQALRATRPRAYTTIMTILDRLAQKGVVQRRKAGRAWVYRANLSTDEARSQAVSQVVQGFFGGSADALASHLAGKGTSLPAEHRDGAVVAGRGRDSAPSWTGPRRPRPRVHAESPAREPEVVPPPGLETALL